MLGAISLVALTLAAAPAQSAPPTAWDGVNPFRCELQQAGLSAEVPHPEADPYCVEFDKRRQNVTELGVVDFLTKEPARVASATPKCFYFQSDHWRGSIVQADESTKTYEFDGHYFFNKATGDGGAWVTNFNVNGQTFDPSVIPGIPPDIASTLGPGTGGAITHNSVDADPACVAKAKETPDLYADQQAPEGTSCVATAGPLRRRRIGPVRLGATDADVRARLGNPLELRRGYLRYCADGGGVLLVGRRADRSGELGADPTAKTTTIVTTSKAIRQRAPRLRGARHLLGHTVRLRNGMVAGVRHGKMRFLAVTQLRSTRSLRRALRRAGVRP